MANIELPEKNSESLRATNEVLKNSILMQDIKEGLNDFKTGNSKEIKFEDIDSL